MITPLTQGLLAGIVALAGIGVVATANAASGDFSCGVATSSKAGMTTYEGRLLSPTTITGEYRFAMQSSGGGGSSNISQGGQFSAEANREVSLGQVMINAGGNTKVNFTITTGGKTFDCSQSANRI